MNLSSSQLIILLDSGPLGMVTHPKGNEYALQCGAWMKEMLSNGHRIIVPEIIDYELRRELLRAGKTRGIRVLDGLKTFADYLPLTTQAMLLAAEFWARARNAGQPTSNNIGLDADMILAAQAVSLNRDDVIIATENIGHLSRFAPAKLWHEIG